EWSDDGSRPFEIALWLAYSMNKEDIWVSRVRLPVQTDEKGPSTVRFNWNLYMPKWSCVTHDGQELRLENRDPYDYARATRVFAPCRHVQVSFELLTEQDHGLLEVEI